MRCGICGHSENNQVFQVREMMLGYRDLSTYFQCAQCQCLQIADPPSDMARYYPPEYYSFQSSDIPSWYVTMLGSAIEFAFFMQVHFDPSQKPTLTEKVVDYYLSRTRITRASRILDVGCGDGSFLCALREIGFAHLLGVDAYIQNDIVYENGVTVHKGTIQDIQPEWDLVMFHHSFEHMPNPSEVLSQASCLLSPQGLCLIRTPTVSSFAWEHYGVDWVEIDAPRHLFVYSDKSLGLLAAKSHLRLTDVLYDSTSFQFWASEQYRRDIPLYSERSYAVDPSRSIFSFEELEVFEKRAQQLNQEGRGDQAAFYLTRDIERMSM